MTLRRLILTIKPDGLEARVLYRRSDGPRPGTVRRRHEVEALARDGLRSALEALDAGEAEDLGTSGYSVREDVLHLPVLHNNACAKKGEK